MTEHIFKMPNKLSRFASSSATAALLLISSLKTSSAEVRSFQGPIEAAASFIHYSEGFIVSPGFVDISNLVFSTVDDNDEKDESSQVEIVLFNEPKNCSTAGTQCDWAELGIGGEDKNGDLRWCCWEDAIDLGLCKGRPEEYGKMIIDKTKFTGQYRTIVVPGSGHQELHAKFGKMNVNGPTGKYVLVMSNCNVEGRDLNASGQYVWMSDHGYLPGDLFGEMYFYIIMTTLYAFLFAWYGLNMKMHEESRIPIQNYIALTIGIGFAEVFFRAGDYWIWNEDGLRFWFAMYTGILMGVIKRSISRCLVVMVSLGWGVVRDDLYDHLRKIYILGGVYFFTSGAADIVKIFSIVENEVLATSVEQELFDFVAILTFVVAAIDVYFYMWILDALTGTMQYLEDMNQKMKLQRYLKLRLVFLISVLFAVVWAVFGIVNSYMDARMLEEKHEWSVQAAWEVNYFMVLTSVSYLWKPDPNAKEYAYVMELPSMISDNGESNFETNAGLEDDDKEAVDGRLEGEEDDMPDEPSSKPKKRIAN